MTPPLFSPQEVEYQRAMQRRAIRDAKTPEKMKQAKPVVDDSLTLQGKKDKIRSNLQRLAELGKVHPENRYQDLINDIAKVLCERECLFLCLSRDCVCVCVVLIVYVLLWMCHIKYNVCVPGHPKPAAVSAAEEGGAGEAPTDQHRPQLQDRLLQRPD